MRDEEDGRIRCGGYKGWGGRSGKRSNARQEEVIYRRVRYSLGSNLTGMHLV